MGKMGYAFDPNYRLRLLAKELGLTLKISNGTCVVSGPDMEKQVMHLEDAASLLERKMTNKLRVRNGLEAA